VPVELFLARNEEVLLQSAFLGALLLAAIVEAVFPRRHESSQLPYRWANNIGIAVVNQLVFNGVAILLLMAIALREDTGWGILTGMPQIGFWAGVIIVTVLLEFFGYVLHRAFHRVPWLWRLHAVHHSDTELDFTSTFRGHPLEIMVLLLVTGPLFLILNLPAGALVLYLMARTIILTFAHSNIYLPPAVDRILSRLIVTPDYHRLHHSSNQDFTDSNYAIAFPWFDHLFGSRTYQEFEAHEHMEIGLSYFRDPVDSRIDRLLLSPFSWRRG